MDELIFVITGAGIYRELPKDTPVSEGTIKVPRRPDDTYIWIDEQWVQDIELGFASYQKEIQKHLDGEAQARGYDNITTACSYAGAENPFQAESIALLTWRSEVWTYCYAELEKVKTGVRNIPTLVDLLSELPELQA